MNPSPWLDAERDMETIDSISRCLMRLKADYQQGLNFLRTEPNMRVLIVTFSEQLGKPVPDFLLRDGINAVRTGNYVRRKPYTRKWLENVRKGQAKRRARERAAAQNNRRTK